MKRLTSFGIIALLGLSVAVSIGCRQKSTSEMYQRYLEEAADTTFEYIPQQSDTIPYEEEQSVGEGADDDGMIAIPDIPQERSVNMSADDYEMKKMMSGRE